jgi:hypothetical protein
MTDWSVFAHCQKQRSISSQALMRPVKTFRIKSHNAHTQTGVHLRAVEERGFKGVLFFVLAIVLLAAIYWVIYYAWN